MTKNLDAAAAALLAQIKAPRGAVNTLAYCDKSGCFIRVLVDPMYWLSISDLPSTFEGYSVVVEKREISRAFH